MKSDTEALSALSPEALQARTFETLRQLILRASRHQPLALVVENLHWIDRASEEFLGVAGRRACPARRYSFSSRTGRDTGRRGATQVLRDPDRAPAARSARQPRPRPLRRAGRDRPDPLAETILARAEGRPVLPGGARPRDGRATAGRRAAGACRRRSRTSLLARISRLPQEGKWALQTAAVLGREVPLDLLRADLGGAGPLEPQLRELTRLEFLHGHGGLEEPVYFFKHALTREVAYESLLPSRRRELHAAAGEALERLYAGRLEEIADRLAHHFARADRAPKAVAYLVRVAERAARTYAHTAAAAVLREALRQAERLPAEEREGQLTTPPSASPIPSTSSASSPRRSICCSGAASRPRASPIRPSPPPGTSGSATCGATWATTSAPTRTRARRSARRSALRDPVTLGQAHYLLSRGGFWSGRFAEGVAHGRRAVALLQPTDARWWLGAAHWAWHSITASWASSSADSPRRARPSESARRSGTRGFRPTPPGRSAGSRRPAATGRSAWRRAAAVSSTRPIR